MADNSKLGEEELSLLEASYRFVADATAYEQFIESWTKRFEKIDRKGLGKFDEFLINHHLKSLSAIMTKVVLDDADPKDAVEDAISSVAGAAMVLSPSNLVVALNEGAVDKWHVLRGAHASLDWLDTSSRENIELVRNSAMQRGNHLHSIVRTFDDQGRMEMAEVFVVDQVENPGLIAIRVMDFGWTPDLSNLLIESFDLTHAETEVCRLLLDVRGTDEIAKIRNASVHTIRTQLRTIFAKTQTANQVDLIRLLGLVSSHTVQRQNLVTAKWQDPLGNQQVFQDSYGRNIAYTWMGDPDGRPAIMSHGIATGYMLHPDGLALLHQHRIKLYCISRPCFGDSDPSPSKDPSQAGADAIVALARHLEIDQWVAVGLAVGAIPVFRAAQSPLSRIAGIVGVSTFIPFHPDESFEYISPARRVANRFIRTSPILAELAVMVAYRMMRLRGPDFIWQTMYSSCEADRAAIKDPECVALIRTASSLLAEQKHKALANDMRMLVCDWHDDFTHCPVPVRLLHGTSDPAIPMEKLIDISQDNPNVQTEFVPDAGELLFFYHSDRLVNKLAEMMDDLAL